MDEPWSSSFDRFCSSLFYKAPMSNEGDTVFGSSSNALGDIFLELKEISIKNVDIS